MAKIKKSFWTTLIKHCQDHEDLRVRLWNGYVGWKLPDHLKTESPEPDPIWPDFVVDPPPDGWPELTEEEMSLLNQIAEEYGEHPSWNEEPYMDFSESTFESKIDFSDLTLVSVDFSRTTFNSFVKFRDTRFFMKSNFFQVDFRDTVFFDNSIFETNVNFSQTIFRGFARFIEVQFNGGATFSKSRFEQKVLFSNSIFREAYFLRDQLQFLLVDQLTGFNGVEFQGPVFFTKVIFGEDPIRMDESKRLLKLADFSDSKFRGETNFSNAVFNGAPSFFNCNLHEDTSFSGVKWPETMPTGFRHIDHAIRAWERLELMMSQLEKPLDRYIFYRLKMRTRQLTDGKFLRMLNRLFEVTCDYGWSVSRAACWWIGHCLVAGGVLFLDANQAIFQIGILKLLVAAFCTAFANAHYFLGLAAEGGYLESCRELIEECSQLGLFSAVGVVQAVLGPVFLFLLLLTLRNRFRLA